MGNSSSVSLSTSIPPSENKVVLVTGAASGVGRGIALTMIQRGYKVYVVVPRGSMLDDLKEAGALVLIVDVSDDEQVTSVVEHVMTEQGRIDVIVNVVVGFLEPRGNDPLSNTRELFQTNVLGIANMTQQFIPHMRNTYARRGNNVGRGLILNVTSKVGSVYTPFNSSFMTSKSVLESWSECLEAQLSRRKIDVSFVRLGVDKIELLDHSGDEFQEEKVQRPTITRIHEAETSAYQAETRAYQKMEFVI